MQVEARIVMLVNSNSDIFRAEVRDSAVSGLKSGVI